VLTGARLGEILALRHSDIDHSTGTLTIGRSIERTKEFGLRAKSTKTGKVRRFKIDTDLLALFATERAKLQRVIAGVGEGTEVDLSLVKIDANALVFWSVPRSGPPVYTRPREATEISRSFRAKANALGHPKLRFHDLRGSHEIALLDSGLGVHVVAARCGHSPAMLLSTYAKKTQQSDAAAADLIAGLFKK
jgi:integrase